MSTLVSIIIVNWNAGEYLEKCIDSLLNQSYENFEIILVDNASSDNSVELVEKSFPQVHVIKNKTNLGFAEANNIGISNSNGKLISLFNPDAIADKEWLSNLISVLSSSDKIAAVAGKILYLDNRYGKNTVFCTWSKIDPLSASPTNFYNDEPASKVDYLSGAAMLVKKDIIEKIGLLDPDYFLYFEDTDWCARMIRGGYDLVYVPDAVAWHAVSPLSSSTKKIYYMEKSRIRFALKNFDSVYLLTFSLIFFGETLFVFFRDIKNRNFLRSKIRIKAMLWNLSNLKKTLERRKKDISILKKDHFIKSYNKSLPLRKKKVRA